VAEDERDYKADPGTRPRRSSPGTPDDRLDDGRYSAV